MPVSEMTVNLSCKKRFWFTSALVVGVDLSSLLRLEAMPDWYIGFIVKYGMKIEVS